MVNLPLSMCCWKMHFALFSQVLFKITCHLLSWGVLWEFQFLKGFLPWGEGSLPSGTLGQTYLIIWGATCQTDVWDRPTMVTWHRSERVAVVSTEFHQIIYFTQLSRQETADRKFRLESLCQKLFRRFYVVISVLQHFEVYACSDREEFNMPIASKTNSSWKP